MTEADLIETLNIYITANQTLINSERTKTDLLYQLVVLGNPEKDIPSMLEVQRGQQKFITTFKEVTSKAAWILIGILMTAGAALTWSVIMHVEQIP